MRVVSFLGRAIEYKELGVNILNAKGFPLRAGMRQWLKF